MEKTVLKVEIYSKDPIDVKEEIACIQHTLDNMYEDGKTLVDVSVLEDAPPPPQFVYQLPSLPPDYFEELQKKYPNGIPVTGIEETNAAPPKGFPLRDRRSDADAESTASMETPPVF